MNHTSQTDEQRFVSRKIKQTRELLARSKNAYVRAALERALQEYEEQRAKLKAQWRKHAR